MAKAEYLGEMTVDISDCSCDEERIALIVSQVKEEYDYSADDGVSICIVPITKLRGEETTVEVYLVEGE